MEFDVELRQLNQQVWLRHATTDLQNFFVVKASRVLQDFGYRRVNLASGDLKVHNLAPQEVLAAGRSYQRHRKSFKVAAQET